MPGIVLLSETNPASARLFDGRLNPWNQVADWYPDCFPGVPGASHPEDLDDPDRFRAFIEALDIGVQERGSRLVVRDYNYVDYFGVPFETSIRLSSSIRSALQPAFDLQSAVLIRHPLPQYDSLRSHRSADDVLSPEIYLTGYETFLRDFASAHFIKYEDIVQQPYESIAALCRYLDLPFASGFLDHFHDYHSVTGNLGREYDPTIAFALWEPEVDAWRLQLQADPRYQALLERLGYAEREADQRALSWAGTNVDVLVARLQAQDGEIRRLRKVDQQPEVMELRAAADARKVALEALEIEYEAMQRVAAERQAALEESQNENRELQRIAGERLEELRAAQSSNEELRAENATLQRTAAERLAALAEAEKQSTELRAAAAERLAAAEAIQRECDMLKAVAEERLQALNDQDEDLQRERELLERAANERLAALESVQAECDMLAATANERLAALNEAHAEAEAEREMLQAECEMFKNVAEERLTALTQSLADHEQLKAECAMFEKAADERLAALEVTQAENEALQSVADARLAALHQSRDENEELLRVAQERAKLLDGQARALEALRAECEMLRAVATERLAALEAVRGPGIRPQPA